MVGREGEESGERSVRETSRTRQFNNVASSQRVQATKLSQVVTTQMKPLSICLACHASPSLSLPLFLPLAPSLLINLPMWRHLKQSANSALNKAAARAAVMPASSLRVYFKFGQSCMSINRQQAGQGRYSPPPLSF